MGAVQQRNMLLRNAARERQDAQGIGSERWEAPIEQRLYQRSELPAVADGIPAMSDQNQRHSHHVSKAIFAQ
jgi:hypothetical protein